MFNRTEQSIWLRRSLGIVAILTITLTGAVPSWAKSTEHGSGRSSTGIPEPFPSELLQQGFRLWLAARQGWSLREQAAWIIDNRNGTYHLRWWPESGENLRSFWRGTAIPAGAVGLLHTHPTTISPKPSMNRDPSDEATANAIQLPVYVVHLRGIWKIEPQTGRARKIENGRWLRRLQRSM